MAVITALDHCEEQLHDVSEVPGSTGRSGGADR